MFNASLQDDAEWQEAVSGTSSINMAKLSADVARLNEQSWDDVRDWKLLAPNPKVRLRIMCLNCRCPSASFIAAFVARLTSCVVFSLSCTDFFVLDRQVLEGRRSAGRGRIQSLPLSRQQGLCACREEGMHSYFRPLTQCTNKSLSCQRASA